FSRVKEQRKRYLHCQLQDIARISRSRAWCSQETVALRCPDRGDNGDISIAEQVADHARGERTRVKVILEVIKPNDSPASNGDPVLGHPSEIACARRNQEPSIGRCLPNGFEGRATL